MFARVSLITGQNGTVIGIVIHSEAKHARELRRFFASDLGRVGNLERMRNELPATWRLGAETASTTLMWEIERERRDALDA